MQPFTEAILTCWSHTNNAVKHSVLLLLLNEMTDGGFNYDHSAYKLQHVVSMSFQQLILYGKPAYFSLTVIYHCEGGESTASLCFLSTILKIIWMENSNVAPPMVHMTNTKEQNCLNKQTAAGPRSCPH